MAAPSSTVPPTPDGPSHDERESAEEEEEEYDFEWALPPFYLHITH